VFRPFIGLSSGTGYKYIEGKCAIEQTCPSQTTSQNTLNIISNKGTINTKYSIKCTIKTQSDIKMKLNSFLYVTQLLVRMWSLQLAMQMQPWLGSERTHNNSNYSGTVATFTLYMQYK
jgi:hypothetical protein